MGFRGRWVPSAALFLRTAWLGWLTSLLALCAWPALAMRMPFITDSAVIAQGAAGMCTDPHCAPEPWLVTEVSLPSENAGLVLALFASALLPLCTRGATEKLVVGMSLGLWVFLDLSEARFIKNYGCLVYRTFSVPEYLTYVAALFVVMLLHAPRAPVGGARSSTRSSRCTRRPPPPEYCRIPTRTTRVG